MPVHDKGLHEILLKIMSLYWIICVCWNMGSIVQALRTPNSQLVEGKIRKCIWIL
jgi:hypothetical protein